MIFCYFSDFPHISASINIYGLFVLVLEYIQVIMGLEEEVQHDVMNAIQEVSWKYFQNIFFCT